MENSKVFVFGSNLAGRHGKGAAFAARLKWGAIYGQGVGRQGDSYAIPTKDAVLAVLPLHTIKGYVDKFLRYAAKHPDTTFLVTAIGTGLAGYDHEDIAPMFAFAPINCKLPLKWRTLLPNLDQHQYWNS